MTKKNGDGRIICLDFRLYYEATVIETGCYLHKNKTHESMDQDIKPRNKSTYLWSINLKERRQEHTMETRLCSLSGTGKTGQLHVKEL